MTEPLLARTPSDVTDFLAEGSTGLISGASVAALSLVAIAFCWSFRGLREDGPATDSHSPQFVEDDGRPVGLEARQDGLVQRVGFVGLVVDVDVRRVRRI